MGQHYRSPACRLSHGRSLFFVKPESPRAHLMDTTSSTPTEQHVRRNDWIVQLRYTGMSSISQYQRVPAPLILPALRIILRPRFPKGRALILHPLEPRPPVRLSTLPRCCTSAGGLGPFLSIGTAYGKLGVALPRR